LMGLSFEKNQTKIKDHPTAVGGPAGLPPFPHTVCHALPDCSADAGRF
jgi:hypothetical protein